MLNIIYHVSSQGWSGFHEMEVEGQFSAVLDRAKTLALTVPAFTLGQILAHDGRVLATVGQQGSVHIPR